MPLWINPLPDLIRHFVTRESQKMGLGENARISPAAMQSLLDYSWPGNVRELQNVIARSLILAEDGCIEIGDLPSNIRAEDLPMAEAGDHPESSLKQQIRNYEQAIIRAAIADADGDRKIAAERLGIGVSSLYRKLEANS